MPARRRWKTSKIVRVIQISFLRLAFTLGSWLAPSVTVRWAGRLFCTPLATSRRRAAALISGDAQQNTLDVDGLQIATYVWGDPSTQPYALFAHGWSSHGTRITPWVAPLLADGYAVVAFDQPGHGRSGGIRTTLPDFACHLLAVQRQYGPAAVVIGHSLGGTAAALAMANGLQARRAVLIAPPADPMLMAEQFARMIGLARHLVRRMFAQFERSMRLMVDELQAQHFAPQIAQPALIVHDLTDREVPWSEGERYARYWNSARILSTTGLGHNRVVEDPGVIDSALRFLRNEVVGERIVSTFNLPYGYA